MCIFKHKIFSLKLEETGHFVSVETKLLLLMIEDALSCIIIAQQLFFNRLTF